MFALACAKRSTVCGSHTWLLLQHFKLQLYGIFYALIFFNWTWLKHFINLLKKMIFLSWIILQGLWRIWRGSFDKLFKNSYLLLWNSRNISNIPDTSTEIFRNFKSIFYKCRDYSEKLRILPKIQKVPKYIRNFEI